MTMYLTFTNQSDADIAADKIWYNYIMSVANNTEKRVGDGTNHYYLSEIEIMTEAQVCSLVVYGKKQGVFQYNSGLTTSYVKLIIAYNDPNLFLFPKPPVDLMANVVNYTEEPYNPDWLPPNTEF